MVARLHAFWPPLPILLDVRRVCVVGGRASYGRLEVGAPKQLRMPADTRLGYPPVPDPRLSGGSPWLLGLVSRAEQLQQAGGCCPERLSPRSLVAGYQLQDTIVGITSPRHLSGCLCHGLPAVAGGIAVGWRMPGFFHACHAPLKESSNR